ncbi:translocation/assembly module TamB domain-containing protein [Shimia biformata]|uniref:translocation/assembly module TamB domain-containing protein n=1 Tax=Shimia biformata TaxID=1294299 RepID=UPI001950C405|nr:translocation/assembly module TamB domain-containing protein [Shimia biformata]
MFGSYSRRAPLPAALVVAGGLALTPIATAQEQAEEKDFLTSFLQDSLSGDGRIVEIEGFRGALSSTASLDSLTIADTDGIWLSLSDVELTWDRLATLAGRIEIESLSAAEITLTRLPQSESKPPAAEATEFALPELPVSINIGSISAPMVALGAPVLGQEATLSLEGDMRLAGGEGRAGLDITRLDGPEGRILMDVSYANATGILQTRLDAKEAENGIIATLMKLPGAPAIGLQVQGEGPLSNFAATIALSSAGEPRLQGVVTVVDQKDDGQVVLEDAPADDPDKDGTEVVQKPVRDINLTVAGDLTPLFAPEYRDFFGTDLSLSGKVRLHPDGRKDVERLHLRSASLNLTGNLALAANNMPDRFALDLAMKDPDGSLVLLPVAGPKMFVRHADLVLGYDKDKGEGWSLQGELAGFARDAMKLDQTVISGTGTIRRNAPVAVDGEVSVVVNGLETGDPSLTEALGTFARLTVAANWVKDTPLIIRDFAFSADDLVVSGSAEVSGLESQIELSADITAQTRDISRFQTLAGRPLGGGIMAEVKATYAALSGEFDIDATATGSDLSIGDTRVDPMLEGQSKVILSAARTTEGTELRRLAIDTRAVTVEGQASVTDDAGTLQVKADLDDMGRFVSKMDGPVSMTLTGQGTSKGWALTTNAQGPRDLNVEGQLDLPKGGPAAAQIAAGIGTLEWLAPELAGPSSVVAEIAELPEGYGITADATGPLGTQASVSGTVAADGSRANLTAKGNAELAVANRRVQPNALRGPVTFDLVLDGPLAVSSVTGKVTASNARLTIPALQIALTEINAGVQLNGTSAALDLTTNLSNGGSLTVVGNVDTSAPFNADLTTTLNGAVFRYTRILHTILDGQVRVSGPLTGGGTISGDIALGPTEINLQAASGAAAANVPEITHFGESGAVRQTRKRAGLVQETRTSGGGGGPVFDLDLSVVANNQIFVRGMGVDAEYKGRIELGGTTNNVLPSGRFEMIRGRLGLVGKRFEFTDGDVTMQGSFIPTLYMVAEEDSDEGKLRIILEGPATEPVFRFESEPSRPQDEVLALILFGRDLTEISAVQAAQLASTAATLSGRGGGGFMQRLRQSTGIDDIDITTDSDGETGLRLGKYINDRLYTNVEIDSRGDSTINLNYDVTNQIKLKGHYGTDSREGNKTQTGIGIYFQKDY